MYVYLYASLQVSTRFFFWRELPQGFPRKRLVSNDKELRPPAPGRSGEHGRKLVRLKKQTPLLFGEAKAWALLRDETWKPLLLWLKNVIDYPFVQRSWNGDRPYACSLVRPSLF